MKANVKICFLSLISARECTSKFFKIFKNNIWHRPNYFQNKKILHTFSAFRSENMENNLEIDHGTATNIFKNEKVLKSFPVWGKRIEGGVRTNRWRGGERIEGGCERIEGVCGGGMRANRGRGANGSREGSE